MLILNMVLNLHLYVIQNNYKCDSPNSPSIHAFTHINHHMHLNEGYLETIIHFVTKVSHLTMHSPQTNFA